LLNIVYKFESKESYKIFIASDKNVRTMKLKVIAKEQQVLKMLISGIDFLREKTFKIELEH